MTEEWKITINLFHVWLSAKILTAGIFSYRGRKEELSFWERVKQFTCFLICYPEYLLLNYPMDKIGSFFTRDYNCPVCKDTGIVKYGSRKSCQCSCRISDSWLKQYKQDM